MESQFMKTNKKKGYKNNNNLVKALNKVIANGNKTMLIKYYECLITRMLI